MRLRLGATAVSGLAALALLAGSGGVNALAAARRAAPSGTFVWAISQNPDTLVPEMGTLAVDNDPDSLIYDGLVRLNEHGVFVPDLATKWTSNRAGTVWTFWLRKGVRWSDGQPFNAQDVVETYKFITNPKIQISYSTGWNQIKRLRVINNYEVQYTVHPPVGRFLADIAGSPILPYHIFSKLTPDQINKRSYPSANAPIGTGPYMVQSWVQNSSLTLVPNPYYWGPKPKIAKFVFEVITDTTTQQVDLRTHTVNMAGVLPQYVAQARHWPGVTLYQALNPTYDLVQLDELHFLKDQTVRVALNLDTPKQEIVNKIMKGQAIVAYGDQVPGGVYYDPHVPHPGYNPHAALNLLLKDGFTKQKSAGAPAGFWLVKGGQRLSVPIWTIAGSTEETDIAEVLSSAWEQIGVYAPANTLAVADLFGQNGPQFNGKDEALIFSWGQGVFPDDQIDFDGIKYPCKNATSPTEDCERYVNPEMSKLTEEGAITSNVAQAKKIYDKVQYLEATTIPIIFLFWYDDFTGVSSDVHGFSETVYGTSPPWTWSIG